MYQLALPLLALASLLIGPTAQGEYTWKGELRPSVLPVEGPRKGVPTPGDIATLEEFSFVLGAAGEYSFSRRLENKNMLMAEHNDGRARCIALRVAPVYRQGKQIWPNPLLLMTAAQKKDLRGISIDRPPPNFNWKKTLADVNWEHCVLRLRLGPDSSNFPPLPRSLRYLELADPANDLSALQLDALGNLRYLKVSFGTEFDLAAIKGNSELRNLDLEYSSLRNPKDLTHLKNLRFVKIRNCESLQDITFVRTMPLLRVFKVDATNVQDFRPLEACPELRLLSGTDSPIAHLPDPARVSRLLDVRLLSTPISKDKAAIARFQQALPKTKVHATWKGALVAKLGTIDRIGVKEGLSTWNGKNEFTFELKDPTEIEALLNSIDVVEDDSGFYCACGGNPWIYFYRADKEVAVLGFHHGLSLRWHGGLWPGDAQITSECAEFLITLMADHGVTGPQAEVNYAKREALLDIERERLQAKIVPPGWVSLLMNALGKNNNAPLHRNPSEDEIARALQLVEKRWPVKAERALNLFRLYGLLPEASWSGLLPLELFLHEHGLKTVESEMNDLLATHSENQQLLQGIARWCLRYTTPSKSLQRLNDEQHRRLMNWTLKHPSPHNRLQALGNLTSGRGLPTLHQLLKEFPPPRPMPERSHSAPEGPWNWYSPDDKSLRVTEQQAAAILLASKRYVRARPLIEKLLKEADEEERSPYQEALKLFDSPKSPNP